jgi:hypothetical protein
VGWRGRREDLGEVRDWFSFRNRNRAPDNIIGLQNGKSTHCFLLTGAFHRANLWGRHCLTASWYDQWHTECCFRLEGVRILCGQKYLLGVRLWGAGGERSEVCGVSRVGK